MNKVIPRASPIFSQKLKESISFFSIEAIFPMRITPPPERIIQRKTGKRETRPESIPGKRASTARYPSDKQRLKEKASNASLYPIVKNVSFFIYSIHQIDAKYAIVHLSKKLENSIHLLLV